MHHPVHMQATAAVKTLRTTCRAVMSPMYAACSSQMVRPHSDLVFVEFVQNDLYRYGGVLLLCTCMSAVIACLASVDCSRTVLTCCSAPCSRDMHLPPHAMPPPKAGCRVQAKT